MGFFDSKMKTKIVDPLAGQKVSAANYLKSLLDRQVPTQQVAPMTGTEQFGQQLLSEYVTSGTPQGITQGNEYFNRILNQPTDIRSLPEYGAIMESVGSETNDAVNRALRRTQLSGMGASGPQGQAVGREVALGGQRMLAQLAPLAEAERNRQMTAANMLAQLSMLQENLQQGRLGAIQQYGALPRQLDQAQQDSVYNQLMSVFTLKPQLAQQILGGNIDVMGIQSPSLASQILPAAGSIFGNMLLASALGGKNTGNQTQGKAA